MTPVLTNLSALILSAILILSTVATITTAAVVEGQLLQQEDTATTTIFQSVAGGFRVEVPNGWVVQDLSNTQPVLSSERGIGYHIIAALCMTEDSLPGIGGTYQCQYAKSGVRVGIIRFSDLDSIPEIEVLERQNKTITPLDVVALQIGVLSEPLETSGIENLRMRTTNDTTVNVIDSETNQTTGTVPAKSVVLTFTYEREEPTPNIFGGIDNTVNGKLFSLSVLDNNTNTGYSLFTYGLDDADIFKAPPPPIAQIFDSFELLE